MSLLQGLYFTLTGLWPLVSMETFLAVTGPKTDLWLVRTVALLITAIGLALLAAAKQDQATFPIAVLGGLSAAFLGWVDAYYALTGVIWPVYLLDAFPEAVVVIGWIIAYARSRSHRQANR